MWYNVPIILRQWPQGTIVMILFATFIGTNRISFRKTKLHSFENALSGSYLFKLRKREKPRYDWWFHLQSNIND